VNGETSDIVADQFYLASVHPGANREPECGDRLPNRAGAANRAGGAVENGQESIAGRLNLASTEAVELAARLMVVLEEHLAPGGVAQTPEVRGRVHDIRAEHRGEDPITVGGRGVQPRACELDRLEGFVADYQSIVTGENVVNVVDPYLVDFAGLGLNAKSSPENHALVANFAEAGLRDWTDIARPPPARLQMESPDRGFAVGYGFDQAVRKAADLFWIAKTLCPRHRSHWEISATLSMRSRA
jgi:hypothetical protein